MRYPLTQITNFLRDELCLRRKKIALTTSLQDDLRVYGDDLAELLERFAQRFSVDMAGYLWYFHTAEEGIGFPGDLFFRPPNARVQEIPITVDVLFASANAGRWQITYPDHEHPPHRVDLWINTVFLIVMLLVIASCILLCYIQ